MLLQTINTLFIFLFILISTSLLAENSNPQKNNKLSFGAIPVFSFDSDLGLKYGAVFNILEYPTNSTTYNHFLNLKISNTTRNTLNLQAVYESIKLIPNATTFLEASYTNDEKLDFFGFNGIQSVYNTNFTDPNSNFFLNKNFYNHQRKWLRFRADIQKNIINHKLRLLTGITFNRFMIDSPKENAETQENKPSLFDKYVDWGIINQNEKKGGNNTYFSVGMIYDTRNDKIYCTSGTWFEGLLIYAPNKINQTSFSKLVLTYRYYHTLKNEKYTFSYRLSSQHKLCGNIPFYLLPIYFDTQVNQDGLGGAFTVRGITRNRLVANGFILGNFESRIKLKEFTFLKQDILISSTLFADLAFLTQPFKISNSDIQDEFKSQLINDLPQKIHMGLGPGINIIYNRNNFITINYGFSPNNQIGNGGLYIGSRFLF